MRIGLFVGSMGLAPTLEGQVQQFVEAEKDGFDSFWLSQAPYRNDVLTLIAMAGQKTQRIEMGPCVVPTFSRHPHTMALQALTANGFSNGRLALGIGSSHKTRVEGGMGLPFDRPAQHMQEYLTVLRALVYEGSADFNGEIFRVNMAHQVPDSKPFPIIVAAHGPRMLRIAGEMAEGVISWMVGPKAIGDYVVPRVNKAAQEAGKPQPRICVGAPIAVTDDVAAAREAAHAEYGRYNGYPSFRRMLGIEGVEGPADVAIVGNEAEVEQQLRTLADAGTTDILSSIFPVGDDAEASMTRTRSLLKSLIGKI